MPTSARQVMKDGVARSRSQALPSHPCRFFERAARLVRGAPPEPAASLTWAPTLPRGRWTSSRRRRGSGSWPKSGIAGAPEWPEQHPSLRASDYREGGREAACPLLGQGLVQRACTAGEGSLTDRASTLLRTKGVCIPKEAGGVGAQGRGERALSRPPLCGGGTLSPSLCRW